MSTCWEVCALQVNPVILMMVAPDRRLSVVYYAGA